MKAKELRIGNLVMLMSKEPVIIPLKPVIVSSVSWQKMNVYLEFDMPKYQQNPIEVYTKELGPIPLTEEWLVKFGFVADGNNFVLYLSDYSDLTFSDGKMYLTSGQFSEMTETVPCDYVHQLQNIYFALTGDELTIKSKI